MNQLTSTNYSFWRVMQNYDLLGQLGRGVTGSFGYNDHLHLSYSGYDISGSTEGNKLVISRNFHLNDISFPPEKYPLLQNFFKVVEGGDGAQVVLQPGSASAGSQ